MNGSGEPGPGTSRISLHIQGDRMRARGDHDRPPEDGASGCPFSGPAERPGLSRRRLLGGALAAAAGLALADRVGMASAQVPLPTPTPTAGTAIPTPGQILPRILGLPRGVGADGRGLPGTVKW